jgi:hypothetical protein
MPVSKKSKIQAQFPTLFIQHMSERTQNSIEYIEQALTLLSPLQGMAWAEEWVRLRMDFHRQYSGGLIFSTRIGADFFQETLRFLGNDELLKPLEKGAKLGEYDANYNTWLVKERKKLRSTH